MIKTVKTPGIGRAFVFPPSADSTTHHAILVRFSLPPVPRVEEISHACFDQSPQEI